MTSGTTERGGHEGAITEQGTARDGTRGQDYMTAPIEPFTMDGKGVEREHKRRREFVCQDTCIFASCNMAVGSRVAKIEELSVAIAIRAPLHAFAVHSCVRLSLSPCCASADRLPPALPSQPRVCLRAADLRCSLLRRDPQQGSPSRERCCEARVEPQRSDQTTHALCDVCSGGADPLC